MEVGGHRKMGRPKLRWSDVIRKDMNEKQVKIEEVQDRRTWRLKLNAPTPNREKAKVDYYSDVKPNLRLACYVFLQLFS